MTKRKHQRWWMSSLSLISVIMKPASFRSGGFWRRHPCHHSASWQRSYGYAGWISPCEPHQQLLVVGGWSCGSCNRRSCSVGVWVIASWFPWKLLVCARLIHVFKHTWSWDFSRRHSESKRLGYPLHCEGSKRRRRSLHRYLWTDLQSKLTIGPPSIG